MDTHESDAVYYRMRERHERGMAEEATVEVARNIHRTMADRYWLLAAKAGREKPRGIGNVAVNGPLEAISAAPVEHCPEPSAAL
jgi:hypothetical protein